MERRRYRPFEIDEENRREKKRTFLTGERSAEKQKNMQK